MTRHAHTPAFPTPLDPQCIAGNTLAILLHALALAVLMMPNRWTPPARPAPEPMVVVPEVVEPEKLKPMPPPNAKPEPKPSATPTPAAAATPTPVAESAPVQETGTEVAMPADKGPPAETFTPGPPALATLAYDVHPAPRYPRAAARAGKTGTVTLKVLVDDQGWPRQVEVETSSGHRELDRAAREQVLSAWRFHPAQREGRAVSAFALVPIEFSLP